MKKLLTLIAVCALCLSALASCGSSALYNYNFDEYVTLGTYKGVEVSRAAIAEDVQAQIDSVLSDNAEYKASEEAAESGNRVTVTYTGTVDGAANENLAAADKVLTVGTSTTGFTELDDALVGMKTGDTKTVSAVVPEGFTADTEIVGKTAEFAVTVSAVEYLHTPEALTDEIISAYSEGEYTTAADYEAYLNTAVKQNLAWEKVYGDTKMLKYPEKEAERYYNSYLASYQAQASQYGMTLEQLASATGSTMDTLQASLARQAVARTYQDMTMLAIAAKEGLEPDDAQFEKTLTELMASYGVEDRDEFLKSVDEASVKMSAKFEMVLEFLGNNAVEID